MRALFWLLILAALAVGLSLAARSTQSVVTGKAEPADALKKAAADLEQYK